MLKQLEQLGAPPSVIDSVRARVEVAEEADVFQVWPDCWEAFLFFLSLRGQWTYVQGLGRAARTGIPSDRVRASMMMLGLDQEKQRDLYSDIRLMEEAVLQADAELRDEAQDKGE